MVATVAFLIVLLGALAWTARDIIADIRRNGV